MSICPQALFPVSLTRFLMDKIRKTGIMKKVNKSRVCQNLSKYQGSILNLSTINGFERRIVSPSPFFYLPYRCICNYLAQCFCNTVGKLHKYIESNLKPLQDKSSCQKWLFGGFGGFLVVFLKLPKRLPIACNRVFNVSIPGGVYVVSFS